MRTYSTLLAVLEPVTGLRRYLKSLLQGFSNHMCKMPLTLLVGTTSGVFIAVADDTVIIICGWSGCV
jgi:hypothetical protein